MINKYTAYEGDFQTKDAALIETVCPIFFEKNTIEKVDRRPKNTIDCIASNLLANEGNCESAEYWRMALVEKSRTLIYRYDRDIDVGCWASLFFRKSRPALEDVTTISDWRKNVRSEFQKLTHSHAENVNFERWKFRPLNHVRTGQVSKASWFYAVITFVCSQEWEWHQEWTATPICREFQVIQGFS